MKNSEICRLCLKSCKANFLPVQETTKEVLDVLLVKMDLDISGNPVKCKECIENLQKCHEFKSVCILNEENIIAILESKHICKTNMTQVYLEDVKNHSNLSKMEEVCRFCIKPVTKFFAIDELDKDINFSNMVQKFLPEVKLSITNNSVTCCNCLNSLKSYFTFLKNCQDVEEYIKAYCKAENITESKVELYNVAQYTLKPVMFDSNAEKDIPGLKKDVFEEVAVTKNESIETYSSDIIIKEEQLTETNSADIIVVDTITTEKSQPVDIYSSDSPATEMFVSKGHLFKNYSSYPVKTEMIIKEEQITEKNSADSIDMDTFTTKVQLVEQLPSDPSDAKALKKGRELPVEEIKKENFDDDVFSEGCNDEINTEDKEMAENKIEDIDIEYNNINVERNEEQSGEFLCPYCLFKKFKFKRNLSTHLRNNHGICYLSCHLCGYKTRYEDCLKKHLVLHGDEAKFQCPQCQKGFNKLVHIDDHLLRKHADLCDLVTSKIHSCDICAFKTVRKIDLFKHINAKHLPSEKYQCNYCLESFSWKECLKRHISTVHLKLKLFNCKGCDRSFTNKRNWDSHILSLHREDVELMKMVTHKIYNCDYCTYKCVKKPTLVKHMNIHKKEKLKMKISVKNIKTV